MMIGEVASKMESLNRMTALDVSHSRFQSPRYSSTSITSSSSSTSSSCCCSSFASSSSSTSVDNGSHLRLMLGPWRDPRRAWIVQSESNVRRERRKRPDPPCDTCKGTGRVSCKCCKGRGRTNFVELAMLPKGEWPNWCGDCKGSGLDFCGRCLGSGERRGVLGFHVEPPPEAAPTNSPN